MKKLLACILSVVLAVMVLVGCGTQKAELALVTDGGEVTDGAFNQGAWEGLVKYAEEMSISKLSYKPVENTTEAYQDAIDLAVKGGAMVVVAVGYEMKDAVAYAQEQYPEVVFILLDGTPFAQGDAQAYPNTVGVVFAEEQAGFLAGYAAVKEGMTQLGFMGGKALPEVVRYGYGFVQGAEYAAQKMELPAGTVTIKYGYTGSSTASNDIQSMAAGWYGEGTECIFACGGEMTSSVLKAAEDVGAKVIGADVDRSDDSEVIVSCATKNLSGAVYNMISDAYDEKLPGGQTIVYDASNNGVQLSMETSKFNTFTQKEYDSIYAALANNTGNIATGILKDTDDQGNPIAVTDIPLSLINLQQVG
ncbi:BMP family protein [uncultured Ruthenibacterium sp.]|uniref:BMP family lipoprotein n=1 Tax=uncultured Ruthenibacterium sp. TaxID=1905347 RepID=UPI00349EC133